MKISVLTLSMLVPIAFAFGQDQPTPAAQANTPPPKIPLRDFVKNPEGRGYLLSPDGKTLSYLAPWESRMNIWVRPTAGGDAKRVTSEKDRDIRNYFWKGNGFLVYEQDTKGDENFQMFRVNLKTSEEKDLTPFPKVRATMIEAFADLSLTAIVISPSTPNTE